MNLGIYKCFGLECEDAGGGSWRRDRKENISDFDNLGDTSGGTVHDE
jgi:hypothetical protein